MSLPPPDYSVYEEHHVIRGRDYATNFDPKILERLEGWAPPDLMAGCGGRHASAYQRCPSGYCYGMGCDVCGVTVNTRDRSLLKYHSVRHTLCRTHFDSLRRARKTWKKISDGWLKAEEDRLYFQCPAEGCRNGTWALEGSCRVHRLRDLPKGSLGRVEYLKALPEALDAMERRDHKKWIVGARRPRSQYSGKSWVYEIYGLGGTLLYVGKANIPFLRFRGHEHGSPWWRFAASAKLYEYESEKDALRAEAFKIQNLKPPHNRMFPTPPKEEPVALRVREVELNADPEREVEHSNEPPRRYQTSEEIHALWDVVEVEMGLT